MLSQLQSAFDCQSATKFSPNVLFSLRFPFISSGVPLQNHTTLLPLKRFPCGYEAHLHQSSKQLTKVQSPISNHQQLFPSVLQRHSTLQLHFTLPTITIKNYKRQQQIVDSSTLPNSRH